MSGCKCCGGETSHRNDCLIPENGKLRLRAIELKQGQNRLRLQLDAVLGAATGQPGADPTPSDPAWSPALDAVRAILREREVPDIPQGEALIARVERLEAALVGLVCGTSEDEREAYRVGREIAGRRP